MAAPSGVIVDSEIILRSDDIAPLSEELSRLYSQGFLTDITLSTEDGKNFEAHRVLLAARSHYFHSLIPRLKSEPVIFLKGVKGAILDKILKYIYGGSVGVSKHQVRPLVEVAKSLQVKGLMELVPGQASSQQQHRFGKVSLGEPSSPFKAPAIPSRRRFGLVSNGSDSPESEEGVKPKRKRGRPPKTPLKTPTKEDPYDFEEEEGNERKPGWRAKKKTKKASNEEDTERQDHQDEEEDKEDSSGGLEDDSKKDAKKPIPPTASSLHGKQVISVKCRGQLAELHIPRFASGVRGLSIRYKDTWMTPQNYESACGCTNKYYLENIQTDYGPLKTLTASGMLKPHSRKCRCSLCRGEEPPSVAPSLSVANKSVGADGEENNNEDEHHHLHGESSSRKGGAEEDSEDEEEESEDEESEDEEEEESEEDEEKRRNKKREEWSRQLEAKLKSEYDDSPPQITPQVLPSAPQTPLPTHQQQQQQPSPVVSAQPQILSTSPLVFSNAGTLVSGAPPSTSYISILDQPPKISPSILPSNGGPPQLTQLQQPERIDTPQTLFVMSSPHPHISAPPTPTHNPFANLSHSIATQISQQTQPTVTMALSSIPQQHQQAQQHQIQQQQVQQQHQRPAQQQQQQQQSRIGSVMQVRCKSTTALLYANKYESGSRGKCIQLGDEWLTPNEFEDRAGSKAKKYLSSIKCLGRPLRVYVNSGELRGSGNAHQAKLLKDKLKTPQPIAPAPPSGGLLGHNGGGIQAPPTPTHVSGSLPPNLNMMMTAPGQPPILINQTGASSIMGSPSIITGPMTVSLGSSPFEVRHSQAM